MPTKLYLNGTVVDYPEGKINNREKLKTCRPDFTEFAINFKNRMKITDAAILMHHLANEVNTLDQFFVTLTYRAGSYETSNKDVSKFINHLSKLEPEFHYLWVKEFTKVGTPHYHALMTFDNVPWGKKFKPWVMRYNDLWCKYRGHYSKNAFDITRVRNVDRVVKYITKYITKTNKGLDRDQKELLKHRGKKSNGRVYSVSYKLLQNIQPVPLPSHHSFTHNSYYNPRNNKFQSDFATVYRLDHRRINKTYWDLKEYYSKKE